MTVGHSLGRYSKIGIANGIGFITNVTNVSNTTITITDDDGWLNSTDHSDAALVVLDGTAQDYVRDISAINTTDKTVVIDSSITGLAADDRVAIVPKPDAYVCIESESLKENINWDDSRCIQDWETTHHDWMSVDIGGDVGFFLSEDCDAIGYLLGAAFGKYVFNSTTNTYTCTPATEVDTGATPYLTIVMQKGNRRTGTSNGNGLQIFTGMQVNTATVDQPAGDNAKLTVSLGGGFALKEIIGTSDKEFSSTYWNPPAEVTQPSRYHFRHFAVLKNAVAKRFAESGRIEINRGLMSDKRAGDKYVLFPASEKFEVTGDVVQWFEDDAELNAFRGGHAEFSDPTEFPLILKWVGSKYTDTSLTFNLYNVVWRDETHSIAGRIKETLNFTAKYDSGEGKSAQAIYVKHTA